MNGFWGYLLGAVACWLLFKLVAWADDRTPKKPGHYGPGPWHF